MSNHYQVSLFVCPSTLPFSATVHPWFGCLKNGESSRWEILWRENQGRTSYGYLHLNFLPLEKGIEILPLFEKYHWSGKLIHKIEGGESSLAQKMFDFIEKSKDSYPFCDHYSIFGPNSNTYAEWVIDHFPESSFKLPWNSFGKNFAVK